MSSLFLSLSLSRARSLSQLQVLQKSDEAVFTWTLGSDLPEARWDAASVVREGRLWLIGGIVDYSPSASVLIYDVDDDTWTPGPSLPLAVSGICAAEFNGEIYVVGGANARVQKRPWCKLQPSPQLMRSASPCSSDGWPRAVPPRGRASPPAPREQTSRDAARPALTTQAHGQLSPPRNNAASAV